MQAHRHAMRNAEYVCTARRLFANAISWRERLCNQASYPMGLSIMRERPSTPQSDVHEPDVRGQVFGIYERSRVAKMTTAPRVEACIDAVMAKYPRTGPVSQAKYYEEVHQHLGPLARELERELAQANADVREMRDILKIVATERFIPEEWERLNGLVKAVLGETK